MRSAVAFGIFALGLTGLFAIACAPSYGEADAPGDPTTDTEVKEKLPNEASDKGPKAKPPTKNTTSTAISTTDASAPPKTPGGGSTTDASADGAAAAQLDGGACSKQVSKGGYIIHEPTPQAIGACSTADIGYYEGLLAVKDQTFGGLQKALKERSELCASCVFSKFEDPTWTPVVMLSPEAGFYNWGSCYANTPGGSPACAAEVQQWFSCLDDACGECATEAEYNTCVEKASADNTQCAGLRFDSCGANLPQLNAACDSIAKTIAAACGP